MIEKIEFNPNYLPKGYMKTKQLTLILQKLAAEITGFVKYADCISAAIVLSMTLNCI